MDYEAVRAGLEQAIPFNRHVGLEILEAGPERGVVRLPEADHLKNHVGSQHAAALFAAAEAASGAAFVGAFADLLGDVTPLAKSAEIAYRRVARGPITATASVANAEALRGELRESGRLEFPVRVALRDGEGNEVAEVTVSWHVRANQPA